MWIVKNMLKATLLLQDLQVKIAAGDYFDVDTVGREKADESMSLALAFEEGYLQNVKKEGADGEKSLTPGAAALQANQEQDSIAKQLAELRQLVAQQQQPQQVPAEAASGNNNLAAEMKEAMSSMAQELAGSLREQMSQLAQQRQAVVAEKQEIMASSQMDESEMQARLAMLDNKEAELQTNLEELGRHIGNRSEGEGDASAMADLLDDL